ncbi:hypothetical protein AAVH_18043 [Aphelenchoides avenae]|nr:hypothetical protein AAVH_18043 [Aphelenchus avenae]
MHSYRKFLRAGVAPEQPYRPPTPPGTPKKKQEKKNKKRARLAAVFHWRYDDADDLTPATEKQSDVVPPTRKRDHPSSELESREGMDHVEVDYAKNEKKKHSRSTAVSYWRYDDDSTTANEKHPNVVPPTRKRGRPRKLNSVEKDTGHVEVQSVMPQVANAWMNTEIARLEKEIEEDKKRLNKLRAELIALESEEAYFLNSGQISALITATKQSDIRQYCELMRRENVASTAKDVELFEPSTRQATIGEFFKTV